MLAATTAGDKREMPSWREKTETRRKNGPKTELTVTEQRRPSQVAKVSAVLRTGDGKRSEIKSRGLLEGVRSMEGFGTWII
jgi:hypothetical protein